MISLCSSMYSMSVFEVLNFHGIMVSESSAYRILKAHDLVTHKNIGRISLPLILFITSTSPSGQPDVLMHELRSFSSYGLEQIFPPFLP